MRLARVVTATLGVVLGLLCVQSHVDTRSAVHKDNTPKHKKVRLKELVVVIANSTDSIDDMIKKIAAGRQDGKRIIDESGKTIAYTNGIVMLYNKAAHDEYLRKKNQRIVLSKNFRKAHEHIQEIVNISIEPKRRKNSTTLPQQMTITVADGKGGPGHVDTRIMASDSRAGDSGHTDPSDKNSALANPKLTKTSDGTFEELNSAESEKNQESGNFGNVVAPSAVTEENHLQGSAVNPSTYSPATKQELAVSSVNGTGMEQEEVDNAAKNGGNITNGKPAEINEPSTLNAREETRNGQSRDELPEKSSAAGMEDRDTPSTSTTDATPGAGEYERTGSRQQLTPGSAQSDGALETDVGAYGHLHAINTTKTPTTQHYSIPKMKHHGKSRAVITASPATINKRRRAMQNFSEDISWQANAETQITAPVSDDGPKEKYGAITSEPHDGSATEREPKMTTLAAASTAEKHEHQERGMLRLDEHLVLSTEHPNHEPDTSVALSASIHGHGDSMMPRNYDSLSTKTRHEDTTVTPTASVLETHLKTKETTEKSVKDSTTSLEYQEVKPEITDSSLKGKNEDTILEIPNSYRPVSPSILPERKMITAFTHPASEAYEDYETTPLSIKYHTFSKEYQLEEPQTTALAVKTIDSEELATRNSDEPGSPSKVRDGKVVSAHIVPELETYKNDGEIRPKTYNYRASMFDSRDDAAQNTTVLFPSTNDNENFRTRHSFKSTFLNVPRGDKMATEFAAPGNIANQKNEQTTNKPDEYIKASLEVPLDNKETVDIASTGMNESEEREIGYSYDKSPLTSAAASGTGKHGYHEHTTSKYYQYFTPAQERITKESHIVAADPSANLHAYKDYWATTDSKAADTNVYNEPITTTYDNFMASPARQKKMHNKNAIPAAYTYEDYQMSSDNELRNNKHPVIYYAKQKGQSIENNEFGATNDEIKHNKITDYSINDETSFSHLEGAPSDNTYQISETAPNIYDFPYNDNHQNFKFQNILNEDGSIPYPEKQEHIFEEQNNPDQNALIRNFEENGQFLGPTGMEAPVQMKDEQSTNNIFVHAFPKITLPWEVPMPDRSTLWPNTGYRIPQDNFELYEYRPRYNTGYLPQGLRGQQQNIFEKQELYNQNMEYEPYTPYLYTPASQANIIPSNLHEFTLYDQSENNPQKVLWSDLEPETYQPASIITEQDGIPQNYNGGPLQYPNSLLLKMLDVPYEKLPDVEFSDRMEVNARDPVPKNIPSYFLDKLPQYADNWIDGRAALGTETGSLYFPYSRKPDTKYAKTEYFVKDGMLEHSPKMFDEVSLPREFNGGRLHPGVIENGVFNQYEHGGKRQNVKPDQTEILGNYIKGPKQNSHNMLQINDNENLYTSSHYEAPYAIPRLLQYKIPHMSRRITANLDHRMSMLKPVNVPVETVPMAPTPKQQDKYEDIYEGNANQLPHNIESTLRLRTPYTGQEFPEKFKAHLIKQILMPKTNHFYDTNIFPGHFPLKIHNSDQTDSSMLDVLNTHKLLPQTTYIAPKKFADKPFLMYAGQEMIGNARNFKEGNYGGDLGPYQGNEGIYINPAQTANSHGKPSTLYRSEYEFDYPSPDPRLQSIGYIPLTKPVEKQNPFKKIFQTFWNAGKALLTKPNTVHSENTRHFTKRDAGSDLQTSDSGEFEKAHRTPAKSVRNKANREKTRNDQRARTRTEKKCGPAEKNLQIYNPGYNKKFISKNVITYSAPLRARKRPQVFHSLRHKITPINYTKHTSPGRENISDGSESHASQNSGKKSGMASGKWPPRYLNYHKTKFEKFKKLNLEIDKHYPSGSNNKLPNFTHEDLMQTGKRGFAKPQARAEHKTNENTGGYRARFGYDNNIQPPRGVNPEPAERASKSDYNHLKIALQSDYGINTKIKESVKTDNNQVDRDEETTDNIEHYLNEGRKELMKTTVYARKASPSEIHTTNHDTMLTAEVLEAKYHYPAEHKARNMKHRFTDNVSKNAPLEMHTIPHTRKIYSVDSYATNSLRPRTQVKLKRDINTPHENAHNTKYDADLSLPSDISHATNNLTANELVMKNSLSSLTNATKEILAINSESSKTLAEFEPAHSNNSAKFLTKSNSKYHNLIHLHEGKHASSHQNQILHPNFSARTKTEYVTTVPGRSSDITTIHQDIATTMGDISENAMQQNDKTQNIDKLTQSSSTQTVTPPTDIWMRGMEFNTTIFHDLPMTDDVLPGKNNFSTESSRKENSQDFQPTELNDDSSKANSQISDEEEYEVYDENPDDTHTVSKDPSYTPSGYRPAARGMGENLLGSIMQTITSDSGTRRAKLEVEQDNLPGMVMPNSHHLVHLTLIKMDPSHLLQHEAGQLQWRHIGEHIHLVVKLNDTHDTTRFETVPELLRKGFVKLLHPPGTVTGTKRARAKDRKESPVHVVHAG